MWGLILITVWDDIKTYFGSMQAAKLRTALRCMVLCIILRLTKQFSSCVQMWNAVECGAEVESLALWISIITGEVK